MGSLGILLFFEDNSIKMEYHTNQMSNYSEYNENGAFFRGPHYTNSRAAKPTRDPKKTNAYLVGGGIASLAAAVHLIQDANVPASQIHILESGPVPGGSMDGAGNSESGYILRGGRMLNFRFISFKMQMFRLLRSTSWNPVPCQAVPWTVQVTPSLGTYYEVAGC